MLMGFELDRMFDMYAHYWLYYNLYLFVGTVVIRWKVECHWYRRARYTQTSSPSWHTCHIAGTGAAEPGSKNTKCKFTHTNTSENKLFQESNMLNNTNVFIPKLNAETFRNLFMNQGAISWNSLPPHLKNATNHDSFKRIYKKGYFYAPT